MDSHSDTHFGADRGYRGIWLVSQGRRRLAAFVAGSVWASCVALAGCSSSAPLSLDSTCEEYFKLSSDVRLDQLNQLGVASGWVGTGNPLYLVDLEARCGSSPSQTLGYVMGVSTPDATSQAAQVSPSTEPSPTAGGLSMNDFAPARTWSWNAESTNAAGAVTRSQFGTLDVGDVIPLSEEPYFEDDAGRWAAGEQCLVQTRDVQSERDAVVPFRITITNTHSEPVDGPSILIGLRFQSLFQPAWIEARSLQNFRGFGGTTELLGCGSYGFDIGPLVPFAPQDSHYSLGFLILTGYYSSEADGSGPSVFDDLVLEVDPYGSLVPPGAAGPGVVPSEFDNFGDRFTVYVSGVAPAGVQ